MPNYSVTIRVLGPPTTNRCMTPLPGHTCQTPAYYSVTARSDDSGSTTGSNVCPEHLFPAIAFFLGLPQGTVPQP